MVMRAEQYGDSFVLSHSILSRSHEILRLMGELGGAPAAPGAMFSLSSLSLTGGGACGAASSPFPHGGGPSAPVFRDFFSIVKNNRRLRRPSSEKLRSYGEQKKTIAHITHTLLLF